MGNDAIGLLRTDPVLNQQVPGFPEKPRPRRITHELKTWPEFFEQTRNGRKKFELRRNDRGFQVGDELLLKEWVPPGESRQGKWTFDGGAEGFYTGRELLVRVDYVMTRDQVMSLTGLAQFVIMSISLVH